MSNSNLTTRPRFDDLTGQAFGRLTVISRADDSATGRIRWLCRCQCGRDKVCHPENLKSGKTQSCGCFQKDKVSGKAVTAINQNQNPLSQAHESFWDIANRRLQNLAEMAEYHDAEGNAVSAEPPQKEPRATTINIAPNYAEPDVIPFPADIIKPATRPVIDTPKVPSNPLVGPLLTETLLNVIDQLILLSNLSSAVFTDLRIKSGLDSSIDACVNALQFEAERLNV